MLTVEFQTVLRGRGWWIFYTEENSDIGFYWEGPIPPNRPHLLGVVACSLEEFDIYAQLEKACRSIRQHRIAYA